VDRTFLIIKPHAVREGASGEILATVERAGFSVVAIASRRLTREEATRLYDVHAGQYFFDGLVDILSSGASVGVLLEGPDAIASLRSLVGATDPADAAPGTIRARFGRDKNTNVVHASDCPERVACESALYFGDCPRAITR
jgi:nucleoside-diphosphate kinase